MNQKKTRFRKLLLLPLLIAVLLFPTQALAAYSCTVQLPVEVKTITKTEDAEIPTGEVYTVVLTAEDGVPLPEETQLTVTDNGTVEFGPITYTKPGDYIYTVYQDVGETEFYTYDRTVYTVTVRVVNDDNGGLKAEIWAIRDDETEKMEKSPSPTSTPRRKNRNPTAVALRPPLQPRSSRRRPTPPKRVTAQTSPSGLASWPPLLWVSSPSWQPS